MNLTSRAFAGRQDLQAMLDLLVRCRLGDRARDFPGRADLEEALSLPAVQRCTRIWTDASQNDVAFAYLDGYDNLQFERDPAAPGIPSLAEIVALAEAWLLAPGRAPGAGLETSSAEDDLERIADLERGGFVRQPGRTIRLLRELHRLPAAVEPPVGFRLRRTTGPDEVDRLVRLHRAAFGTVHMTCEERLAMMHSAGYEPELDLLAVSDCGEPAAFCLCRVESEAAGDGGVDTIGTAPAWRGRGLARVLLMEGLRRLYRRRVRRVRLGTSDDNGPMLRLAEATGFVPESGVIRFIRGAAASG